MGGERRGKSNVGERTVRAKRKKIVLCGPHHQRRTSMHAGKVRKKVQTWRVGHSWGTRKSSPAVHLRDCAHYVGRTFFAPRTRKKAPTGAPTFDVATSRMMTTSNKIRVEDGAENAYK
jgi:hypothetical protein